VQNCARGCAATRCEASANHHGKIQCAVLIVPEGIDKNGAQFRLHRMAVAGGTHAKKRFHAASALRIVSADIGANVVVDCNARKS